MTKHPSLGILKITGVVNFSHFFTFSEPNYNWQSLWNTLYHTFNLCLFLLPTRKCLNHLFTRSPAVPWQRNIQSWWMRLHTQARTESEECETLTRFAFWWATIGGIPFINNDRFALWWRSGQWHKTCLYPAPCQWHGEGSGQITTSLMKSNDFASSSLRGKNGLFWEFCP